MDHLVVHTSNQSAQNHQLETALQHMGFEFNSRWTRIAHKLESSFMRVGREYVEFNRSLTCDAEPREGIRARTGFQGVTGIMLKTNDLAALKDRFERRGIEVNGPWTASKIHRSRLIRKRYPWQVMTLPPIPGTDLEIGFVEYDAAAYKFWKLLPVPNSTQNGLELISRVEVALPAFEITRSYLRRIFTDARERKGRLIVALGRQNLEFVSSDAYVDVKVEVASSNERHFDKRLRFGNLELKIVERGNLQPVRIVGRRQGARC